MNNTLLARIRDYAMARTGALPFGPASEPLVERAEQALGLSIPTLLRSCYLTVGNGGFGPGYGVIGLSGGYASDYGCIVEAYELLKRDQESEGRRWREGLLPFCEWGCNIFSCVDCQGPKNQIYIFENFDVWPQGYTIEGFFEAWMKGIDILSCDSFEYETIETINPFTGKKDVVKRRRRRK